MPEIKAKAGTLIEVIFENELPKFKASCQNFLNRPGITVKSVQVSTSAAPLPAPPKPSGLIQHQGRDLQMMQVQFATFFMAVIQYEVLENGLGKDNHQ